MTKDEIASAMRGLVADRLAAQSDRVTLESRLIPDLGADSLDIMDLLFAIKGKFQVDIRPDELNFAKPVPGSTSAFLPRDVVEKLTDWLPALKDVPDPDKVTPAAVFRSISVGTLCLLVERKLAG